MDGILNFNKPAGITSLEVVSLVKKLTHERHVGHAGTLDPIATGVLPICLGKGTRVIEFLVDATKTYRAEIELGVETDSFDGAGQVVARKDASCVTKEILESALGSFRGNIEQTPPMYSAVRHHGMRLYDLARAGITVERKIRQAHVLRLDLFDWQPPVATIEVVCGKGTYIRTLAHDLGQNLGCGAYLKSLVRMRSGVFDIKDAITPEQFKASVESGDWQELVYPVDAVLGDWPAMVVDDPSAETLIHGHPVTLRDGDSAAVHNARQTSPAPSFKDYFRTYTSDGSFLGVVRFRPETGQFHPDKMFLTQLPERCHCGGQCGGHCESENCPKDISNAPTT